MSTLQIIVILFVVITLSSRYAVEPIAFNDNGNNLLKLHLHVACRFIISHAIFHEIFHLCLSLL